MARNTWLYLNGASDNDSDSGEEEYADNNNNEEANPDEGGYELQDDGEP